MTTIELEPTGALMREIARYLALVDLLRRDGREPRWLPEPVRPVSRTGDEAPVRDE